MCYINYVSIETNKNLLRRNNKDSVFTYLFGIKKYALELYKTLKPNDKEVTENDIDIITLETILINGLYNDLGLLVKNTLILLVEAQSTWSENIVVRLLLYLGETLANYFKVNKISLYSNRKVQIPNIDLYVIYTGDEEIDKDEISLNELFYGGKGNIDINVKVISSTNILKIFIEKNIISEYIDFASISTNYEKTYGRSKETAVKIIDECINKNILKEFMQEHKKEVVGIMDVLYDQDVILESYEHDLIQQGMQKGIQQGMQQGMQKGIQQGMQQLLLDLYKQNMISREYAANKLNMTVEEFLMLAK